MGCCCSGLICSSLPCIPCCGYSRLTPFPQYSYNRITEVIYQHNPKIRLRDMKIISSHNMGTYGIPASRLCSGISKTQYLNISEQLARGVRHLDLRYAPSPKDQSGRTFSIYHGPHHGHDYIQVLYEVLGFLKKNSREFLILICKYEKKSNMPLSREAFYFLMDLIAELFRDLMIKKEDMSWFNPESVTLEEILDHKKNVLVMYDKRSITDLYDDEQMLMNTEALEKKGLFMNKKYIFNAYFRSSTKAELLQDHTKHIKEGLSKDILHNLELILTPPKKICTIWQYVFCMDSVRVDQKQRSLVVKDELYLFIRKAVSMDELNIFMLDMVHFHPEMIYFLIGLNFNQTHIKVKSASFEGVNDINPVDVKEKVEGLIVKCNSLWIIDLEQDLGIKDQKGRLKLSLIVNHKKNWRREYSLVRGQHVVVNTLDFDVLGELPSEPHEDNS